MDKLGKGNSRNKSNTGSKMASINNSADGANESSNKEKENEVEISGVEGVDYIEMTVKLDTTMK
jgi:hypothetical protein